MKTTKQKILPFVFASGLLASSFAQAAQLGKLEILSGAGEPFQAQILIDQVAPEERASLQAKLASPEAFKAARLFLDPDLNNLQFVIQDGPQEGTALVKITASKPLPAGFIDTLVELTWAGGRVAREYTLTIPLEPVSEEKPASAALPEIRPPMTPPATTPAVASPESSEAKKTAPAVKPTAESSTPGSRKVKRGETLSELASGLVDKGVSLNQAMAAIYEANKSSFINGSVHLIREGAQIQVPNRTALRAKSAKEALLVLANNDGRNVYSAYAVQIGLLTAEKQSTAVSATSSQGSIAPTQKSEPAAPASDDRLKIAPGSSTGKANADSNAEELLAKNKALAEANERIALLEKNVTDLQRLLDMQKDLGEATAGEPAAPQSAQTGQADGTASEKTPGVALPSDVLGGDSQKPAEATDAGETAVTPTTESAPTEPVSEDVPFDWMPWILGGAGGLVGLVVLLLVIRARKNKSNSQEQESDFSEELSFSEVHDFDQTVVAADVITETDRSSGLNKSENSDFDLDDVLDDRSKPAEPEELKQEMTPSENLAPQAEEPPLPEDDIPELVEASDESRRQKESLESEVSLEFPEDDPVKSDGNSILDDLDSMDTGVVAAQEELDEIRKQPVPAQTPEELDASAAFDEIVQEAGNPEAGDASPAQEATPAAEQDAVELDVDVPNPKMDEASWQEVATKLDLAGAYVEIGDADGAKELLNEIVKKGDTEQVRKAKALLATLN